ncbi:delta-1-pyrroline-5-carboxylate dehydrogenase, mitochondrial-like [Musca vetustissima]|uniref:delta-1-pyrroline-5-carboxylate dehydrogenase, mitochondrial-like n=1 Tax=Musca vetustissima TaxID=27455 RepID=UPI002AB795BF|nr:delta-1-pyrroline-5-carboxylate dehydrogenase, mitochondrial-like [Musca vetustissima]
MLSKFIWNFPLRPLRRLFSSAAIELPKVNKDDLNNAVKKIYSQYVSIPIAIGEETIYSGDAQNLQMPHNHQRIAAKYYYATRRHIQMAIERAMQVQNEWANTDIQYRANCFRTAAKLLSEPGRSAELMTSIMLGQAKTRPETERDFGRLIRMLHSTADYLIRLSEVKLTSTTECLIPRFVLRPLDGFVACTGPINTTWRAAYLAVGPLIMGNVVLWRPPRACVHSAYIIYKALIEAGIMPFALQFLPSNYRLFLDTVIRSPSLGGVNYAGRLNTLRTVWHDIAIQLIYYKCFPRLVGECDSKGYHFVHESADMEKVVDLTITAAFSYSGQRPNSCARLYVPDTKWPEIKYQLENRVGSLKIGDPTDEENFSSAIIRAELFDNVVEYLNYAHSTKENDIIVGGNFNKSHGYFIEPTVVLCKDPHDRLLVDNILGPVLSVYVYESSKLDDVLKTIGETQKFGGCGSIFAKDEDILPKLLSKLRMSAGNLYVNNQCTGGNMSHLPLSGNRLSGTNDKNGSAYYLLRFAAPQMIEEAIGGYSE